MRISDVDVLIVPGWSDSPYDHWQSRWARNMKTARRVEQSDWLRPDKATWVASVLQAVSEAKRPAVLVGHSLGVATILHAADHVGRGRVAGAFLVAPSDLDAMETWPRDEVPDLASPDLLSPDLLSPDLVSPDLASPDLVSPEFINRDWAAIAGSFAPMPSTPLPFPARVIASSNDAFCSVERAQALSAAWGADVSIMADGGHINSASGHGPWPEGLLTFGAFLKALTPAN